METAKPQNIILELSFQFAIGILKYTDGLMAMRKFVLAQQLLKSGTSIGANVREAQHAESLSDFIHKLKIANKEAEETVYWLELCKAAEGYPAPNELLAKITDIQNVLSRIIISSKARLQKQSSTN